MNHNISMMVSSRLPFGWAMRALYLYLRGETLDHHIVAMGSSSEVTTISDLSLDLNRKNAKTQTAYSFCYCKHCENLIRFIITSHLIGTRKKSKIMREFSGIHVLCTKMLVTQKTRWICGNLNNL